MQADSFVFSVPLQRIRRPGGPFPGLLEPEFGCFGRTVSAGFGAEACATIARIALSIAKGHLEGGKKRRI
jgi:hypothetical protein